MLDSTCTYILVKFSGFVIKSEYKFMPRRGVLSNLVMARFWSYRSATKHDNFTLKTNSKAIMFQSITIRCEGTPVCVYMCVNGLNVGQCIMVIGKRETESVKNTQ